MRPFGVSRDSSWSHRAWKETLGVDLTELGRMLLESAELRRSADHVFFAAGDSLSAESGVRSVREYGLPLRATAGSVTRSPLASREAEEVLGMPCMSIERIMNGTLREVLGAGQALEWSTRDDVIAPTEEVA